MHLLGSWRIEVVEGSETHTIELSEIDLRNPLEFPQMAFEDWCTDDIGVGQYDEIRFIFVPSPKVWSEDGMGTKSTDELYELLVEAGVESNLDTLEKQVRDEL